MFLCKVTIYPSYISMTKIKSFPMKLNGWMPKLKETSTILAAHLQEKETDNRLYRCVGTTHSESSASQSKASNQPMLGNGGVNNRR
jgi:hypothetical protein